MYVEVKITAVANRDESCNLFTFSETHRFSIAQPPTAKKLKDLMNEHKIKFLDMWPHNRQASPILVPLDMEITERDGRMAS